MLPKQIFVWEERNTDGSVYLFADKELSDVDGQKVGIYQLKETKIIKVKVTAE